MIDTIIKMHKGSQATSADSIASIDIPEDGKLVAIQAMISDVTITAAEVCLVEISFLSTNQISSNDARGSIFQFSLGHGVDVTSGGHNGYMNTYAAFPDGIPINAGERIHMHCVIVGSLDAAIACMLYLDTRGTGVRRARKRR